MKIQAVWILVLLSSLVFASASVADDAESVVEHTTYLPSISKPLLISDDFSNPNSGWLVADDGQVKWSYQNGEYEILIRVPKWWAGARAPINGLVHYAVEAEMRRLSGSTSDYGLIFDFQDWTNFYYFIVDSGDQWYGVAKIANDTPQVIVPLTNSPLINPNTSVNHLKVVRVGNQIDLYINGHHLKTANDAGFGGGLEVGLYMESDSDAPASVRYDNFVAWDLGTGKPNSVDLWSHSSESPATGSGSMTWDGP
ncbi:MAG: hypothetical protein GWP61_03865 [Chloroflexi bacterium]|nr:hypothetical protein [Chloroflexota bacterium]